MAKIETPEPGIYPGVPFDEYLKWEAVNHSFLHELDTKSPAHAKESRDSPKPPSEAFEIGTAVHKLCLEPFEFDECYSVPPKCDRRTKEGKAMWAEFQSQCNGKKVIEKEDYLICVAMVEAIQSHKDAREILRSGELEVCIVWIDKRTGLLCKARLDYVHLQRGIIADLKSARDAGREEFAKAIWNYGYHSKAAFYIDGLDTLLNNEPAFVFVAVEKTRPFAVGCYEAKETLILAGRNAYRRALDTYKKCIKTKKWPAYGDEIEFIDLPRWALSREGINERYML